jgi:hypothetical protein
VLKKKEKGGGNTTGSEMKSCGLKEKKENKFGSIKIITLLCITMEDNNTMKDRNIKKDLKVIKKMLKENKTDRILFKNTEKYSSLIEEQKNLKELKNKLKTLLAVSK